MLESAGADGRAGKLPFESGRAFERSLRRLEKSAAVQTAYSSWRDTLSAGAFVTDMETILRTLVLQEPA